MRERQILTEEIRIYLEKEDIILAIIRAATDLQQLLMEKLFFEKGITFNLVENWNLERFIEWCDSYKLIDKEQVPLLNLFKKLRNIVFHRRTMMGRILKKEEHKKVVKDIIISICNFIDKTKITYESSQETEQEYTKMLSDIEEKYNNFLSDYYRLFPILNGGDEKNDL